MADALTHYHRYCTSPCDEITPGQYVKPLFYSDYRERHVGHSDLLLYTPTSWAGRAIARYTGGPGYNFSHVEAALWWHDTGRLMCVGYQEGVGGAARPLSQILEDCNGHVHVYGVETNLAQLTCLREHLVGDLGKEYKWSSIILNILNIAVLSRYIIPEALMLSLVKQASSSTGAGICSQHIARSFRICSYPLVDKQDALVTPNDIAQSALTRYKCTLVLN